jgi:transcriptional antiterminator RfaH
MSIGMPLTAASSARKKSWYLVYTKPRQEEVALANLARQGYGVYLPRLRQSRKRRGKRVLVIEPLFPRYLFINLDSHTDNWIPIRSTLGVMSLVRFGTEPARVPDDLVAHLKSQQDNDGLHDWAEPKLAVGDRARVAEGPLAGYEGVLLAKSGRGRVILLLDMLGHQVRAQIARDQLEPPTR